MSEKLPVSASLKDNVDYLQALFKNDITVKIRQFSNIQDSGIKMCVFFVDGLASEEFISEDIICPIMRSRDLKSGPDLLGQIRDRVLISCNILSSGDMNELLESFLRGDAILLMDGCPWGVIISAKNWTIRSVNEPDSEKVIQGPHEGFNESIMTNLALLRRKITNPALKYEFFTVGKKSVTLVCMCYMEGLCDKKILQEMRKRILGVDIDCIIDAEYIEEIVKDGRYSPFKTTGSTERPDIAAAKLMEGRIAVVINGSPVVITAPFVFMEYFTSGDDYYNDAYYATFNRILRFIGFFFTISLPALYIALITHHIQMLPVHFLIAVAGSRQGMPFSTLTETLILIVIFEMVREGSAKIPSSIGTAFSIVGGIVLGEAAVSAHFVSLPVIIIVAFSGITGLIIPQLKGPVIVIRLGLLFLAASMGIFGYFIGIMMLIFAVCSLRSFGVPYNSLTVRDFRQLLSDTFVRDVWPNMKKRPVVSGTRDVHRQANGSRRQADNASGQAADAPKQADNASGQVPDVPKQADNASRQANGAC